MAFIFSKESRKVIARRISGFWYEFKRKRIGVVGVIILAFFVGMALLAPLLTPYDPINKQRVAQDFAMPEWMRIFPQYANYPTTRNMAPSWTPQEGLEFVQASGKRVTVQYTATKLQTTDIEFIYRFSYQEIPPNTFYTGFNYAVTNVKDLQYTISFSIDTPENKSWLLWTRSDMRMNWSETVSIDSKEPFVVTRLLGEPQLNLANAIFAQKGNYVLSILIRFKPQTAQAQADVTAGGSAFTILGMVHGILGTDDVGSDLWSQLVYGSQISLVIGITAAGTAVIIGTLVGVVAGYAGGLVDELLMRLVDILLVLPFLPLLLTLVFLYGKNVMYIVLFIAIFGWQGLARMVRSQILSLRETAFVECARASGGSKFYIMRKHLIPNVFPIVFPTLVLSIPSAILFEASLSFLGFGDPRVPTWGKMLQYAFGFGAFTRLAWWWIIPPGLAITSLCLGFVFMGHSFDEILNPRLRRRR
jgi:peptide/nickel transport system permease protein